MRGLVVVFLAILAGAAGAEVKLPALICDHMVLQRGQPARVWGWADAGERVSVSFNQQAKAAVAGVDGRWSVLLDAMSEGGPYELTVSGKNSITLKDVLIGDVWFCAGQSNMGLRVLRSVNGEKETQAANFPKIRLFTVDKAAVDDPRTDCKGAWALCEPKIAGDFSAIGYFFGRELHQQLNVPIGLIHSSWLGTSAEAWISRPGLEAVPALFDSVNKYWQGHVAAYPERQKVYDELLAKWTPAAEEAKQKGEPLPKKPSPPWDPKTSEHGPHRLFNGMIAPVTPFTIRGFLWYQGEGNIDRGYQYRELFPALICDYRRQFGDETLPFIFAQIGGWRDVPAQPKESSFSDLRESQLKTMQTVSGTAMAVTLDICEGIVHFANKQEAGRRAALGALAKAYGRKDLVYSGPIYESMSVESGRIRLKFSFAEGLEARGGSLKNIAIAGADRKFVWADAVIENDTVVVSSPSVSEPVAVRYAWGEYPACTLFNKAGLPASPFRTDDWQLTTQPRK